MKTYGAINPKQIIDLFNMRAKIADHLPYKSGKDKLANEREAVTWRAAADILDNTEFVGWTEGKRVGELIPGQPAPEPEEPAKRDAVTLSLEDARDILAALSRKQAVESAANFLQPRETHKRALAAIRAAIGNPI